MTRSDIEEYQVRAGKGYLTGAMNLDWLRELDETKKKSVYLRAGGGYIAATKKETGKHTIHV